MPFTKKAIPAFFLTLFSLLALLPAQLWAKGPAKSKSSAELQAREKASQAVNSHISFTENKGQVTDQFYQTRNDIQFALSAQGMNIFVGNGAIHYEFSKEESTKPTNENEAALGMQDTKLTIYRMDVELVGANKYAEVTTAERQSFVKNYYTPGTGDNGAIAYSYNRVTYKNIYDHIDWVLYVKNGKLKHEFVIHEGGRASDIKLKYSGTTGLKLDRKGMLTASTPMGTISEQPPYTYQADGKEVPSSFRLDGTTLSYEIGKYTGELVIDPTLNWATYYGGSDIDIIEDIDVDASEHIYVTGRASSSSGIATSGAHQITLLGIRDALLVKMDMNGSLQWATYYGGPGNDFGLKVIIDATGFVYISGNTSSLTGIATPGAHQTAHGPTTLSISDAFLAKFNSSGVRQWGTYYGGGGSDFGGALAIDAIGDIYMFGTTGSSDSIVTPGAFDTTVNPSNTDFYLVKFTGSGTRIWCTYFGGAETEQNPVLATDRVGNVILAGMTGSTADISSPGAFQVANGGALDAFIAKFDGSGNRLWSTYYGGNGDEWGRGLLVDGDGNIYLCGETQTDSGMATVGTHKLYIPIAETSDDGFLVKFNSSGSRVWGTYHGGSGTDYFTGIAWGEGGDIILAGTSFGPNGIATPCTYQPTNTLRDWTISRFDTTGHLVWGTFFGSTVHDVSFLSVATNGAKNIYVAASTDGTTGINTTGGYQPSNAGSVDGVIARFRDTTIGPVITGPSSVCASATITLSSPTSGGTWSSSTPAVATVGSASGIVAGVSAGTATITYNVAGCIGTKVVSVTALSSAGTISGTLTACAGNTSTLASTITGGIWTSANTAVATIGSSSGTFTGVSPGTATISYAITSCGTAYSMAVVSINATSAIITGTSTVSYGGATTLSCATSGGTWSSSNPTVATVSAAGIVSGISVGAATITYTLASGCYTTLAITVVTDPIDPITGPLSLCMGTTGVLACVTPSGVSWTSSDPTVATIGITSGVVTPVSPGTSTITFTVSSGAYTTSVVTVNPLPSSITGVTFLCTGTSTSLSSSPSGGTWASSNAGVATVGTAGNVTGVTAGTSTITYTLSTGCKTTTTVSVGVMPAAITGTPLVCVGNSITLASATPGGTWSSDNTAIATISGTGITTGVGAGNTTISYLLSSGCARTVEVTVNAALDDNTGTAIVCVSLTTTLSNTTTGGTWSSSNTARATVNATTGLVTGINPGTVNITYTVSTGCIAVTNVNVNAPLASISGTTDICVGTTTTFTHPVSGGTWSSSNTAMATVGSASGTILGISAGTPTITYTAMGCFKTKPITINGGSAAISGNTSICQGSTSVLSCSTTGGTIWVSGNTAVATVGSSSGVITGISVGTASISYLASSGCTSTTVVSINPLPTAISGTLSVCQAATTALASIGTTGGTWVSSNVSKATIGSSSGIVTGVSGGTANITYTWTNTCKRAATVTVNPLPSAGAIVGAGVLAIGATQTLTSSSPGGTWASSNPARATIVAGTGFMTGISAGTVTITYTNTNSCGSASVTRIFSIVTPRPRGAMSTGDGTGLFSIYPNPTAGAITIESAEKGTFNVYTIDGRQVGSYQIEGTVTALALPAQLASGIYIGRFVGDNGNVQIVRLVYEH